MIGAAVNTHRSALVGVMSSFKISLMASATGCSTPYGPTRIGPRRDCAQAMTLRSSNTMYVTPTSVAFRTITILSRGMTNVSIIAFQCRWGPTRSGSFADASARIRSSSPRHGRRRSTIHLTQDDVDRANQGHDIGDKMSLYQSRQRLQVAERRRPDAEAVRVGRLAVADDEVAEFALWRLDRVIRLTRRRLDQPWHLADDWTFRKSLRRLANDAQRLAELLHAHQVAVVGVAGGAERNVEVHLVVRRVGFVLAHVARDAGSAKRRAAHPERGGFSAGNDADALGAFEPDAIVREQGLVLVDFRVHDVAEREHLLIPSRRKVQRQAADPHRVVRQARAAELFEQVENQLALAERVEEHRHRADVHRVRAHPEAVARDALQLAENRADVARAPRHFDLHQLLDRLAVADVVRRSGHVVHPVGQKNDLRPVAVLAQLLDAAMQIADDDFCVHHLLAVQTQHDPQHAVRARMLRPHVD